MFPYPTYTDSHDSFRSELEATLTRGGPAGLAYSEANKYSLKQQLLETHEDPRFGNLKLKEVDYQGNRRQRIYALGGTIPISHKNGKFNIPIEVFLPPDFPVGAPAPYVRPTTAMCLAPSHPFVDVSSGMVNTPAVVSWSFPSSKLAGVLAEMSTQFGEQSPVYARPANDFPSSSSPQSTPAMSLYGSHHRPPPANPPVSNPYPATNGSYFPNPLNPSSSMSAQPSTMYPTYPPAAPSANEYYPALNPYIPQPAHPAHPSPDAGLYGGTPGARPPSGPPAYPVGGAAGYHGGPGPGPQAHPPPPPSPGISAEAAKARRSAAFRRTAVESLTKRLLASLQQSEPQIQEKTVEALEQRAKLEENRKVVADACAEKKAELRVMERNVTALSATNAALRSWLQAQEPRAASLPAEITPSTAIVPADSLCEHALSAQAEDMAIEESVEVLSDSLKAKSISPEVYIKVCRELAEAQFRARLLGNKLQAQQHDKASAVPAAGAGEYPGQMQAGVMMPQGDNWRLTATYNTP